MSLKKTQPHRQSVKHKNTKTRDEMQMHLHLHLKGGSVAEWLACWTQAQTLSGNSLRQTVYTQRASVHQAEKLVTVLLRVAGVTAGLAESNGSLPSGL